MLAGELTMLKHCFVAKVAVCKVPQLSAYTDTL